MWSGRSNLLLILLSAWTALSGGHELLRKDAADPLFEGEGRHLTECRTPLTCCPVLKFLSNEQAQCNPDGGYEVAYKINNTVPYEICQASYPTVLILAGLEPCKDIIKRVILELVGPVNRTYGEEFWPYTVFGDDPTMNTFNDEYLPPGTYTLNVRINSIAALPYNRCILFLGTYTFTVTGTPCPAVCTA